MEILLSSASAEREWDALVKPGRRARPGAVIELEGLAAEVVDKREDGRHRLRFSEPIEPHLDRLGHMPLPPYIHRPDTRRGPRALPDRLRPPARRRRRAHRRPPLHDASSWRRSRPPASRSRG